MSEFNFSEYLSTNLATEDDRRRYAQNSLIVDTAVALNKALEEAGWSQKLLAERLGRSEGFVSQVLSGGGNLTLRTLADFAYGLGCVVDVCLRQRETAWTAKPMSSWQSVNVRTDEADSDYALAA
jgi:transcriptional regulator with XRE-family HTH domain